MVSTRANAIPGSVMLSLPVSTPSSAKLKARLAKTSTHLKRARKSLSPLYPKFKAKPKKKKPWEREDSEDELDFEDSEDDEAEEEEIDVVEAKKQPTAEVETKPIFTTFNTDEKLDEGICIIRALGGGKYEIVNMQDVSRVRLGAEATTNEIKDVPGRRDMFNIPLKEWEEVSFKAGLAVKNVEGNILRFQNFPLEVRRMIYKLVLVKNKPLAKLSKLRPYSGMGLLLSCRALYEESLEYLYHNTFRLSGNQLHLMLNKPSGIFRDKICHLDFSWHGNGSDRAVFRAMSRLPQLKTLALEYNWNIFRNRNAWHRWNILYQDEAILNWDGKGIYQGLGFDELVQIRGLKKVTIKWGYPLRTDLNNIPSPDEQKLIVEKFLSDLLTLPKVREIEEIPEVVEEFPHPRLTARQRKMAENAAKKS